MSAARALCEVFWSDQPARPAPRFKLVRDVDPGHDLAHEVEAIRRDLASLLRRRSPRVVDDQPQSDWLSVDEVAKRLDLSRLTILRRLRSGEIQGTKIGGVWRVRAADLDALMGEITSQQAAAREAAKRVSQAREAQAARARAARAQRKGR